MAHLLRLEIAESSANLMPGRRRATGTRSVLSSSLSLSPAAAPLRAASRLRLSTGVSRSSMSSRTLANAASLRLRSASVSGGSVLGPPSFWLVLVVVELRLRVTGEDGSCGSDNLLGLEALCAGPVAATGCDDGESREEVCGLDLAPCGCFASDLTAAEAVE